MDDIELAIKWAEQRPWAAALADCQQDPEWHREGDVWRHTTMVMRALPTTDVWNDFTDREKRMVIMGALFHDISKPDVTYTDTDGRVRSPKHSVRGECRARKIMYGLGVDPYERETAANLVRFHMKPIHILDNDLPERTCIETSEYVGDNRLLYALAMADNLGRLANDIHESIDKINLWRDIAKELGVFDTKLTWNPHTRTKYLRDWEMHHSARINVPFKFYLYMMVGLPGSGKSTLAAGFNVPVIEPDAIRREIKAEHGENEGRVWSIVRERVREYARKRQTFVLDAVNLVKDNRASIVRIMLQYGATIKVVHVDRPIDTVLKQNSERKRPVPENAIMTMMDRMQIPRYDECHEFTRVI